MSSGNELTPQQEFDKVLSNAAVDIARMEQVRDTPGRPGRPAPEPKPGGAPPTLNAGAKPPVNKDFQNNLIAEKKAETLKKLDQISNKVSGDVKKEMQAKAYKTLYPPNKKDLNQVSKNNFPHDKNGRHMGDKEVDNAQERANALRSKETLQKGDTAIDKSQERAITLKEKHSSKNEPKSNMSSQYKQSLEGNKVQAKDVKNSSKEKSGSMGTRFSQSLSQSKPLSHVVKSSPSRSTPSGRD